MSEGKVQYVPCSPGEQGAFEATLIKLAEDGKAAAVQPPKISMRDFEKVLYVCSLEDVCSCEDIAVCLPFKACLDCPFSATVLLDVQLVARAASGDAPALLSSSRRWGFVHTLTGVGMCNGLPSVPSAWPAQW